MECDSGTRTMNALGVPKYEIASATPGDVQAILDLQEQNLHFNGGSLSYRLSGNWFEKAITDSSIVVSLGDGKVVGYAVSMPLAALACQPIFQAMLCVHPGSPGAYNFGPICVAESHRKRGLARAMFEVLRRRFPSCERIALVRSDNVTSQRVHKKMGMREVAKFVFSGSTYGVLACNG